MAVAPPMDARGAPPSVFCVEVHSNPVLMPLSLIDADRQSDAIDRTFRATDTGEELRRWKPGSSIV
jgi:hypothetical protein